MRKERGWRWWHAIGLGAFVALLAWMLSPTDHFYDGGKSLLCCQNNLRQIGELLTARAAAGSLRRLDGAAFLLQVASDLNDDDLKVFICPAERGPDPKRPTPGMPESLDLYRKVFPRAGPDGRMCSYAGPDFTSYPDRPGDGRRIWACDRCRGGVPHHRHGLSVLWSNGKVEVIPFRDIAGCDPEKPRIILGPDSPDPRLRPLMFLRAPPGAGREE
ncbi:MAG: hypothetical protein MUE73_12025 [Planctomycetes bacterium]|jgi:hypothetical protein|nr:hypothetical protein [Planctomycetota bacterium]